jgi:mannose-6-phosphate isomerase-like protein (cupin superfamily)
MSIKEEKKQYKLQEKVWILASENNTFEDRKSSQGCDLKVYVNGNQLTCGTFNIPPGMRFGRISAHATDETYYVINGTLKVELPRDGEIITVNKGEVFYMPGGMIHAPFNDGDEECDVLWHCGPDWP